MQPRKKTLKCLIKLKSDHLLIRFIKRRSAVANGKQANE